MLLLMSTQMIMIGKPLQMHDVSFNYTARAECNDA